MHDLIPGTALLPETTPWEERMAFAVETMREMSRISDPQELVKAYGARMRQVMTIDGMVSLSRRGLKFPQYRITRSSRWESAVNPWKQKDQLPVFDIGLLGELIYQDQPLVINDLHVSQDDPAYDYFLGMKSLMAIPLYEQGQGINMVVLLRKEIDGFPPERLPMQVWVSNLFGRATHTLVLSNEVKTAYDAVERELKAVADIQRSLLPSHLPAIKNLELAAYYQTSRHAGGDYYDFFKMPNDQWGILMADVSGHGTPAAVLMAITHSIAHVACDPPCPPAVLLAAINARLTSDYNSYGNFVTAFYGVYDANDRTLTWSNAGHPPPRLRRADGSVGGLPNALSLPLGIEPGEDFAERTTQLAPGDLLLFYTDGITEARDPERNLFEDDRLDDILRDNFGSARQVVQDVLDAIETFSRGQPLTDDRTLLAARVT